MPQRGEEQKEGLLVWGILRIRVSFMEDVAFELSPEPSTTDKRWVGGAHRWRAVHKPESGGREVETCLENSEAL